MATTAQSTEFRTTMRQLDELLQDVETISDPAARAKTGRIIQGLMEFHGAGLNAIFERLARAGEAGRSVIDELARDELAGNLLLLYGLHPLDLETRVKAALEKVRPYLASHGGNVELLGISEEGVVHLAMRGSCHGCPSSAVTMKTSIEQAIYDNAPDVSAIQVDGATEAQKPAPAGFVPVEMLIHGSAKNHLQGVPS
ncbi:MAG: nfuA 2 [Phycisphaerales bacterium]|nr:nfuA 2 [Phycisphaerales bacterium]